jgi:hypothetical protein
MTTEPLTTEPLTTDPGQAYAPAARQALAAFGVEPADLHFVRLSENVTFRATDRRDGSPLVLRLHRPWYHDIAALRSEHLWTRALVHAGHRQVNRLGAGMRRFCSGWFSVGCAGLGNLAPDQEGSLTRGPAEIGSDGFGVWNVEEVRYLIVKRQKPLRLPG